MSKKSRRDFFKSAGLASAGLVVAATPASASSVAHLPDNAQLGML